MFAIASQPPTGSPASSILSRSIRSPSCSVYSAQSRLLRRQTWQRGHKQFSPISRHRALRKWREPGQQAPGSQLARTASDGVRWSSKFQYLFMRLCLGCLRLRRWRTATVCGDDECSVPQS
jgi:hypothetical protein